jgi:hypothetical protein
VDGEMHYYPALQKHADAGVVPDDPRLRKKIPDVVYVYRFTGERNWPKLTLPKMFQNIHIISIREERFRAMEKRMGGWVRYAHHFPGTLGWTIDVDYWKSIGKVDRDSTLRRGELVCFDSHFRLWEHFMQSNEEYIFILEDDAEMYYNYETLHRFRQVEEDPLTLFYVYFLSHQEYLTIVVNDFI